jgi:hypothetical protein
MKKIIFMLAASVFCFQIAGLSQTRVGLSAGVTSANMKGKVEGDRKGGLITSLVLDAPIGKSKNFCFHPSLSYVQKGIVEPHPDGTLIEKQYVALRYAELTTDFLYYIHGAKGGSFYIGAGPSVAFNIPSKKVSVTDGTKTARDINFGSTPENDFRGVDYGADFATGYRTKGGFFVSLNYNHGIRNLVTEGTAGHLRNNYIGVQLGVFLNNGGAKSK